MDHFAARVLRSGLVLSVLAILAALVREGRPSSSGLARATRLSPPSTEGPARVGAECAAEPLPASDVTYVCDCGEGASEDCRPGDDAASGADPAHALRTIEAAAATFDGMRAGGTVALCRGGAFRLERRVELANVACSASLPCTLRDYATSASSERPPPRLVATNDAVAFVGAARASRDGSYRVRNLELVGRRSGTGLFVVEEVSDLDVCNVTIRGFQIGMHVAGANGRGLEDRASERGSRGIRLRGSRLEENFDMGYLGSCDGCAVEWNVFRGNAKAGTALNHPIYFDGHGRGERIVGNVLVESVHDRRGRCNGAVIVVHGRHEGLTIEDNAIHETVGVADGTCWGIALDPGDANVPERFEHVVVRRNRIDDVGNVSIGLAACVDCTVEDNRIRQGNAFEATGIEAPDRASGPGDARLTGLTVRNNRVTFRGLAIGTGVRLADVGQGHAVRDNTLEQQGRGAFVCVDAPRGGGIDARSNRCIGQCVPRDERAN